jgi:multiple sugar transport system substrate-binding protein
LLYRKDLADKAGVAEADLTRSWESYHRAAAEIKAATGAYLLADAPTCATSLIRTGLHDGDGIYFDSTATCSSTRRASCAPSSWAATARRPGWMRTP